MTIQLDSVPLRAAEMTPAEVPCSESRAMRAAVPEERRRILAVPQVGAPGDGDQEVDGTGCRSPGTARRVVDAAAHRSSRRSGISAPGRPPRYADALNADRSGQVLSRPVTETAARDLLALLAVCTCAAALNTEQYDAMCAVTRCSPVNADGGHAVHRRVDRRGHRARTDASGRHTLLDPYAGAQLALAEARNVITGHPGRGDQLPELVPEDPGGMYSTRRSAVWLVMRTRDPGDG